MEVTALGELGLLLTGANGCSWFGSTSPARSHDQQRLNRTYYQGAVMFQWGPGGMAAVSGCRRWLARATRCAMSSSDPGVAGPVTGGAPTAGTRRGGGGAGAGIVLTHSGGWTAQTFLVAASDSGSARYRGKMQNASSTGFASRIRKFQISSGAYSARSTPGTSKVQTRESII